MAWTDERGSHKLLGIADAAAAKKSVPCTKSWPDNHSCSKNKRRSRSHGRITTAGETKRQEQE